ncbi:hypothetical protein SASPL_149430 [Salvia splendens]|uniref:Protein kinase domain-containing protein n=1 Tax=Salvia splendens TaxID=180675 RepID=A0A8X8WB56_SALSN|nr:hypothetical protein SASPL_149430 [Salvia splendens]
MVVVSKDVLILLLCLLRLLPQSHSKCKESYSCRNFTLRFPFTDIRDPGCGLFAVGGCDSTTQEEHPRLQIGASTSAKYILNQPSKNEFIILDFLLQTLLESPRCFSYMNVSLPQSPSVSFTFSPNITFFACFNKSSNEEIQEYFESYRREECDASTLYYKIPATESHNGAIPRECSLTQLPVKSDENSTQLSEMLTSSFTLEWSVSEDCDRCYRGGGQCLADNRNQFYCEKTGRSWGWTGFGWDKRGMVECSVMNGANDLMESCFNISVFNTTHPTQDFTSRERERMALGKYVMLLLCHLLLLLLLKAHSKCPKSYPCGNFTLQFPFTVSNDPHCGLYLVDGCDSAEGTPTLRTRAPYQILRKTSTNAFLIHDREIQESLDSSKCYTFIHPHLLESPFVSFTFSPNITFFTCYNQTARPKIQDYFQSYRRSRCQTATIYYKPPPAHQDRALPTPPDCVFSRLPYKSGNISADPLHLLTADFTLEWSVHQDCYECHHGGGQCYSDNQQQFYCRKKDSLKCGDHTLNFPLTRADDPDCGLIAVDGCDSDDQSLLRSPSISVSFCPNLTLFPCKTEPTNMSKFDDYFENYSKIECLYTVYYKIPSSDGALSEQIEPPEGCWLVQLPMRSNRNSNDLFSVISADFTLEWEVSDECVSCCNVGGQCLTANNNTFYCKRVIPGSALLLACALYIWLRKKKKVGSYLLSRNLSYDPSSKSDIEDGSFNFGIPIFSYNELVEATGNFDPSKELGDGGFGTVYYGKLQDGREVAIKRLYEHNYRRVEQFLNEIKILTSLRHPNLIQKCAFDELIDPATGYNSDAEVTRMTTTVAELAFRCLQLDKDMRPTMVEVVAFLHDIESGGDGDFEGTKGNLGGKIPPSPETDEVVLLKSRIYRSSPTAVTDTWISSTSTTASSVGVHGYNTPHSDRKIQLEYEGPLFDLIRISGDIISIHDPKLAKLLSEQRYSDHRNLLLPQSLLTPDEFTLMFNVSSNCFECYFGGGQRFSNSFDEFYCNKDRHRNKVVLIVAISAGGLLFLLCLLVSYMIWLLKRRARRGGYLRASKMSLETSKSDINGASSFFGIPIFSYTELEAATNIFDPSRELGDGGFGTVYYGKLQDGREVAIKRLYEQNCRRMEQFMNEIEILTSLRHPNLVCLRTDEINLANLALTRIQRGAFHELADPSLGYNLNAEVTEMVTSVAEIAFQCLQLEKEMRPSMAEVLALLKDISN